MATIGTRYTRDLLLKLLPEGALYQGTDLTFKRSVLILIYDESDKLRQEERLRWLGKASRVTGERFLHLLDFDMDADNLYVVLQAESGGLLADRLRELPLTSRQALHYAHELALAVREARVERLPECSLDAQNLWIDRYGRLRILNFWTEGGTGRRGVPGIALLLYQLAARTEVPTASIREYSYEIRGLLADLPEEQQSNAIALACQAYEGDMTLSDLQRGLAVLLGGGGESTKTAKPPESMGKESNGSRQNQVKLENSGGRLRVSISWNKWPSFAIAGIGLLVLLLWLAFHPNGNGSRAAAPLPSRQASPERTPTSIGQPSTSQALATIRPTPTIAPAPSATPPAKPSAALSPSASTGKLPNRSGVVPDVTGHSLDEAEQMVIAAGLRYQYFLQLNPAPQDTVFKQDLAPGTPVKQGDRITLWVSKGKE